MRNYRISVRADGDIAGIADYTIKTFGIAQARLYRVGLEDSFQLLADDPTKGKSAEEFAPNLRRWNYKSHAIFFVPEQAGILVVRVLHLQMDFRRHPMTVD